MNDSVTPPAPTLEQLLRDLAALDAVVNTWDEPRQLTAQALRTALEDLHGEALRRMIRILQEDPHSHGKLREAVRDEVVYAVLRRHGILRASLQERIEEALEAVRPMLASHGGNVELVSVTQPDTVTLRLLGSCDGCPASMITLTQGIEQAIREACPEITQIKTANPGTSSDVQTVRMISPYENAESWRHLARADEVAAPLQSVSFEQRTLLLVRTENGLRCFENACAHLGLELHTGLLDENQLTCPHHGFTYELDEGQCLSVPELCLQKIPVRNEGGNLQVYLP